MKSFLQAIFLGVLASLATFFTFSTNLPTWVLFLGWTSYFLFCKNILTALKIYVQQLLGLLIAILIITFGNYLVQQVGAIWFHFSVAVILMLVFYVTKLKKLNTLSAYFLGMIIWFGLATVPSWVEITKAGIALLSGFVFGWLNDNGNKRIDKVVMGVIKNTGH